MNTRKTVCPPGTREKQRRATRRFHNLRADMLLTLDEQPRKRRHDPTVYEPIHTFEDWDQ